MKYLKMMYSLQKFVSRAQETLGITGKYIKKIVKG